MKFYAVVVGRKVGIYTDWEECKKQISGVSGAQFKSFFSRAEAEHYIDQRLNHQISPSNPQVVPEKNPKIIPAQPVKRKSIKELPLHGKTKMYTDGSSKGGDGGYGLKIIYPTAEIVEDYGKVPIGPNGEEPTNQRAELYAIMHGLEITEGDLVIYSDSMYSIKCMTEWIDSWEKNGWRNAKGNKVANQDLIKNIYQLMQNRNISYVHVPAHVGIAHNERVDRLAKIGRAVRSSA
jgi:ribonuclease HI